MYFIYLCFISANVVFTYGICDDQFVMIILISIICVGVCVCISVLLPCIFNICC